MIAPRGSKSLFAPPGAGGVRWADPVVAEVRLRLLARRLLIAG
jgi:hypothetical protein